MGKKLDYEIIDHGAEHAQYWQGAGVAGTDYVSIRTGIGSTAREAARDAYEQIDDVGDADTHDLAMEIGLTLDDTHDAHAECWRQFEADYKPPHVWSVSRQRPWNSEPAEEYIEISPGGFNHTSPGQVGNSNDDMFDPKEVKDTALAWSKKYGDLPIYFGTAEIGCGPEDTEDEQSLLAWIERVKPRMQEAKDRAWEKQHDGCEVEHFVSIRYRVVDTESAEG